jgi:hypothetical protein
MRDCEGENGIIRVGDWGGGVVGSGRAESCSLGMRESVHSVEIPLLETDTDIDVERKEGERVSVAGVTDDKVELLIINFFENDDNA